MTDDGENPGSEKLSLRTSLLFDAVFVALGMGCVSFAFWVRWVDDRDLMHPFPLFLAIGTLIVFFATRRFVHTLAAHLRRRRSEKARDRDE